MQQSSTTTGLDYGGGESYIDSERLTEMEMVAFHSGNCTTITSVDILTSGVQGGSGITCLDSTRGSTWMAIGASP